MLQKKTHREVKSPQISARYLADYMSASEQAKRTIVRGCKYQAIARVIQHNEAKAIITNFVREENPDVNVLIEKAQNLRERLTDDDFERDVLDHNADYVECFANRYPNLDFPADAELLPPAKWPSIILGGVKITAETHFRLQRLTRNNKVRTGIGMLRYSKGKALPTPVGEWQSAFLYGYLDSLSKDGEQPEHKLCFTLDTYGGIIYTAPTDAARRFKNMEAACTSIAERWSNIAPPPNAIL